ncbi:MAG: RagB/SusD family nutrient uptake outer membrane protein [Segetibacter sp.]
MKKLKYKMQAPLMFLLLAMVSSCKKSFLDSAPYAVVADNNFYLTTEQCRGAVFQAYNRTVHLGPIYLFIRHALNDYAGDDLLRTNTDDFTIWYNFSPDNVQFLWGWKYCFQGIYLCNYTINKLANAPIPQADKDQLSAECKTIRALMYYLVATRWGQTPIITDILPIADYYKVSFSKAPDVYAQVIKDLNEAIPNLPKTWEQQTKEDLARQQQKCYWLKPICNSQVIQSIKLKTGNWHQMCSLILFPREKELTMGLICYQIMATYITRRMTRTKNLFLK